jgi:macrolide transport system ATP-binding/permease protein
LLTYLVYQRRKEFSIRAAVGATQVDLAGVVVRESLSMAVTGAVVCLLAIPVASAWWRALTAGMPALDAWAWVGTPAALLTIAAVASLGPARAAARQASGAALRED